MSLETSNLNFKGNNPGAVKYGNFINYYQFHPADNRIKMLPSTVWDKNKDKYVCLDIGCNAGDLTVALHSYISQNVCPNVDILGIDIDSTLICRSEENCKNNQHIAFKCLDIMNDSQHTILDSYLSNYHQQTFDIVFCFSTTMWIHLNNGDEGLKKFLRYICSISKMIVIEPHPWKCYRTAVKRLKLVNHEFPYFKQLEIKPDVEKFIKSFILEQDFKEIHESDNSGWGRKILIFINQNEK